MTQYRIAAGLFACAQLLAIGGAAAERVSGPFNVSMTPAGTAEREGRTETARMLLDKQYFGDLAAGGKGQMLSAVTDTKGSASYVAIERVSGTLKGRKGSFVIQHAGTMSGGAQQLAIGIVPDSGTGQLEGIAGTMAIRMEGRKHFYDLDYTLPAQ
jgi:hypothetical protein